MDGPAPGAVARTAERGAVLTIPHHVVRDRVVHGDVMIDGVVSPFSSHIREYSVSGGDPDVADPTPTEIISWVQPRSNHNGGWIGFGPPGGSTQFLYIMSGIA